MPPRRAPEPSPEPSSSVALTSLNIPEELRRQLLQEQMESAGPDIALPVVKIMGQGVNLFEFQSDSRTVSELSGVVLHSHPRNTLWDSPIGGRPEQEEPNRPACASPDGKYGVPRPGYVHAMVGTAPAVGTEVIACEECRYNQFESAPLVGKLGRGKACSNQQSLFILLPGEGIPHELSLPATSLVAWREYLMRLVGRNIPLQGVVTSITLERKTRNELRWSVALFREAGYLDLAQFQQAVAKRREFARAMGLSPAAATTTAGGVSEERVAETTVEAPTVEDTGDADDHLPF